MQTLTIDIIDSKAIRLLQDLELLKLIRVRPDSTIHTPPVDWEKKYQGAMAKQSLKEIDNQLDELRNAWE